MAQVEDPQAASDLLKSYGATKFRFIDMSGCECLHSPKDRQDHESTEDHGMDPGLASAKRGYAKVINAEGQQTGWAKRRDQPIFAEAERVLKAAIRECSGLIQRYSIRVGGARAVPSTRYAEFRAARQRCREITTETMQNPVIIQANEALRAAKRDPIWISYEPNLFPELSLSDPEDLERVKRVQESVSAAIALVCEACRSGDRERIRYVIEQVGALGDSVSDPVLSDQVGTLLKMAEKTVEAITERGRAQSATMRANPETRRGQEAAERFLAASATETKVKAELAQIAGSIFSALDLEPTEATGPQIGNFSSAIETETPILAPEDEIAAIAAEMNGKPVQPSIPDIEL